MDKKTKDLILAAAAAIVAEAEAIEVTVANAPVTIETDFDEGDDVVVAHIAKDGTLKMTTGTVDEVLGEDKYGYYTRITGDNGKHYKVGLKEGEVRRGSAAVLA